MGSIPSSATMKKEIDILKEKYEDGDRIRCGDLEEVIGREIDYKSDIKKKEVCVFCNAEWTFKMFKLYEESGYCESCWWSETVTLIYCGSCGKIVYKK